MIARLQGEIVETEPGSAVIDVRGVGYLVYVPDSTLARLPGPGEPVVLYTHTHVREDAIVLYGFLSKSEKRLFETVVGVAGVGPKLALAILSHMTPEEFAGAVALGDERRLTRIPGIGKKTAARILLELKDKLAAAGAGGDAAAPGALPGRDPVQDDAVAALMALGYSLSEAQGAVSQAKKSAGGQPGGVEHLIRAALRLLDRAG